MVAIVGVPGGGEASQASRVAEDHHHHHHHQQIHYRRYRYPCVPARTLPATTGRRKVEKYMKRGLMLQTKKGYFQGKMFKNIGKNHKNIPLSGGVVAAAGGLWSRPAVL